jgi:hypothetical protein
VSLSRRCLPTDSSGACGEPDARQRACPVRRAGGGNGTRETWSPRLLPTHHLSYDARAADLLFEVITRRYQRAATIVTTNKPFAQWHEIFPNAASVVTLVDRLTHQAEIIQIEGESYRLKESRERNDKKLRRRAELKKPPKS